MKKTFTLFLILLLATVSWTKAQTNQPFYGWGANSSGQLGNGTTTGKIAPEKIGAATNWASVAAGNTHSIAIKTDGTIWAWGSNSYGELGDGTNTSQLSPKQIGAASDWAVVSAGNGYSLAIKTDGTLWAWGRNTYGQLGDGTTTSRNAPVQVGSAADWASISAGYFHSLAVKKNGALWAWGYNAFYHLGDNTNVAKHSPIQVGTDLNWASASAGGSHSVGVKTDGTVWAWGRNTEGQLGNGTTVHGRVPAQVGTATNWVSAEAGGNYCVALKEDGTLWAWGQNSSGQAGDGTTTNRNVPVCIDLYATNWASASAGGYHTVATKTDGSLWAWGSNGSGELGDGTTNSKLLPVRIGTGTKWVAINAGHAHSMALVNDDLTEAPVLQKPQQGSQSGKNIAVEFSLGESAKAATVQLSFIRSGGEADENAPHIITFDATYESAGQHAITLDGNNLSAANGIVAVSSGANDFLVNGAIYTVSISYQGINVVLPRTDENTGFTYNTTPPAIPAKPVLARTSDTGVSDGDGITHLNTPEIQGTAEAGVLVSLYIDNEFRAAVTADANGNWSSTIPTDSPLNDGWQQVEVTATNEAGTESGRSEALTIGVDTQAPTILTKEASLQLNEEGTATLLVTDVENGTIDDFTEPHMLEYMLDKSVFSCTDLGVNEASLIVTDLAGNVSSVVVPITVQENMAPVAVGRNINVPLDVNGEAVISASAIDNGSSDNCGIAEMSLDKSSFSCADKGNQVVTLTVKDASGNTSTVTATVTIEDKTAPVVTAGQIFTINENSAAAAATGNVVAADNCAVQSYRISEGNSNDAFAIDAAGSISVNNPSVLNYEAVPEFTLTVEATDPAGNTATEVVRVLLNDVNEAPVLAALEAVRGDELSLIAFTATATDEDAATEMQYSLEGAPAAAAIDAATGAFSWTPTEEQGGETYSFTVVASDGALRDAKEISVVVNEVNQAPVVTSEAITSAQQGEAYVYQIQATDADLPANTLSFEALELPSWLSFDAATQLLTGTPDKDAEESSLIRLQVSDGQVAVVQEYTLTVELLTGIFDRESKAANQLVVYPNPTKGGISVRLESKFAGETISIKLLDLQGKILVQEEGALIPGVERVNVYLEQAKAGIYLLQLQRNNKTERVKVIKE